MAKKNTILMGIIIAALAVAAFLVYKSFSGPADLAADPELSAAPSPSSLNILPLGNKFDTSSIKKIKSQFNVYTYPKVSPGSVGVSITNLIKSPAELE